MEAASRARAPGRRGRRRRAGRGSRAPPRSRSGDPHRSSRARTIRPGVVPERLGDARRGDDAAERQVAARDALREHDQVGLELEALDPEPRAEAAEAADDAVGDRQHAVPATDLRHRVEVAVRRRQDAARADHGLEDEGGDVLGAEPLDLRLERRRRRPRRPATSRSTSGPNSSLYGSPRMLVPIPCVPW